jgi:hypothetical protein
VEHDILIASGYGRTAILSPLYATLLRNEAVPGDLPRGRSPGQGSGFLRDIDEAL